MRDSANSRRTASHDAPATTKTHIRGSSLLLAGRLVALGLNLAAQLLTVRYLSKSDFGALAYVLAIVSIASNIALLGLDKAVARFVPIYQEQRNYRAMFGTVAVALTTVLGIGFTIILLALGFREMLGARFVNGPHSLSLLLIVIALVPLQALDNLFEGLLAVVASPRAIFFRRHLLGPALRLAAIVTVVVMHGSVFALAMGHVAGGALGVCAYVLLLWNVMRSQGLLDHFQLRSITMPARDIFAFTLPLLSTDIGLILRNYIVIVVLAHFSGTTGVAEFRAVLPVAGLNLLVFQSFKYLFMPMAARLFARNDQRGINDLYWKTAIWIAVMSFPLFAATFCFAHPLTILLFGERYAGSGSLLAILSLGQYFNAAMGFNTLTLKVYAKVRYIVLVDILSAITSLGLFLLLIPRYGAWGAAVATSGTVVLCNVLNQAGLFGGTPIDVFQRKYLKAYLSIVFAGAGLLLFQLLLAPPLAVSALSMAVFYFALIRFNRDALDMAQMFPELRRVPFLRPLLGV